MLLKVKREYATFQWLYLDDVKELNIRSFVITKEDIESGFEPSKFMLEQYDRCDYVVEDRWISTQPKQPQSFVCLVGSWKSRDGGFAMIIDTEVFLLNDSGKTVDRIVAN